MFNLSNDNLFKYLLKKVKLYFPEPLASFLVFEPCNKTNFDIVNYSILFIASNKIIIGLSRNNIPNIFLLSELNKNNKYIFIPVRAIKYRYLI